MRLLGAIVLLLVTSAFVLADFTSTSARVEIDTLLSRLEQSGCEFYRNGGWYSATEAKSHLRKKLQAAGAVQNSTELFIDRLASKSSMSGKPYLVRCSGSEPVESKAWLTDQLRRCARRRSASEASIASTARRRTR